jgi:catechol 2,3-dioxygenase-like lactoylglutathione lyase family enzyme
MGGVEHLSAITLVTRDMATAVDFYDRLGFDLLYGGPDAPFTSYRVGAGFLNLQLVDGLPQGPGAPGGWGRVILWVDDVDAMHERVTTAGFATLTEPADAPWGERYFHLHDPDGHELSFARPLVG